MRQVVKLLRYGVPWSEVMEMDTTDRLAYLIACQEADGHKFNWHLMTWDD